MCICIVCIDRYIYACNITDYIFLIVTYVRYFKSLVILLKQYNVIIYVKVLYVLYVDETQINK